MKKYEKYKDSGVEWLGEIPEHWNTISIKYLADGHDSLFIDGNWIESDIITEDGIRYLTSGNIGAGFYKEQGNGHVSEETFIENNFIEVFPGDLLISRLNEPIGRACIIPELGKRIVTCVDNVILRPKAPFNRKYLMYLMNSKEYSILTSLLSRGATMKRISRTILGQIRIPAPQGNEQIQIANYLDHQTTIINQLITEKESFITKLQEKRKALINEVVTKGLNPNAPMRDSGIEWLGMIPKHWKLSKMKFIGTVKGRIGFKGYSVTDLVDSSTPNRAIVLGGTNVMKSGFISYEKLTFLSYEKYEESPEIMLKGGEILITKVGAGVGENAIYTYYEDKVTINPNVMLLVVDNDSMDEKFVNYFLLSDTIKSQIHIESQKSGAQPAINQSFIKNLPIFVPNKIEQSEIVNFIESRTTKIDATIGEIQLQLQKLKEYKTAVISEVVTGKVDVREWKPQT